MRQSAEQLAAAVPATQWIACSAGHGAKGRRLYDWTRVALAAPAAAGMARWLLVRRRRRDGELALYACSGPAGTPLAVLVRVAGTRWAGGDVSTTVHSQMRAGMISAPILGWGGESAQRRRVYQPGGRDRRWRSSASWRPSAWMIQRWGRRDSWRARTQPRRI
jgi:hypothetical protein